jgi:hypothetical protein
MAANRVPAGPARASELLNTCGRVGARSGAREFLRTVLAGRECLATGILEAARLRGPSERTLRRAFRDLGGQARKEGYGAGSRWWWRLPGECGGRAGEDCLEGGQQPSQRATRANELLIKNRSGIDGDQQPAQSAPHQSSDGTLGQEGFRPTSSGRCQTCRRWGPVALTQLESNSALNVCEACHARGKAAIAAMWTGPPL